jgi:steroid 5-alpha reductase family enzyme
MGRPSSPAVYRRLRFERPRATSNLNQAIGRDMRIALAGLIILLMIALSATMALAWLVAMRTGRWGWIDAIWSLAVGAGGIAGSLMPLDGTDAVSPRQWLAAGLAGIWSLRLGCHLAVRTIRGGDDPRYRQLRKEWGDDFRRRLFWFLQIQAAAALILVVTVLTAARHPTPGLGLGDLSGVVVFLVAVIGEALADWQLSRFGAAAENEGKVCNVGLWRFSRHPNYFFEWLAWVAYIFIAIDVSGAFPWGWLTLSGPVLMYWLLVHVSGIPPLEAHMLRSRGDQFRDYQRRVNAFWPAPPKGLPSDTSGGAR